MNTLAKITSLLFIASILLIGCQKAAKDSTDRSAPDRQDKAVNSGDPLSDPRATDGTDTGLTNASYQSVFDADHAQNTLSNRMEKNFSLIEQQLSREELFHFKSAGIEIYQPKNMKLADKFTGFLNQETGTSIVILTNPFSMKNTTTKIVADSVRASGKTRIVFTKQMTIAGRDGVFYLTKEPFGTRVISKYIVAFGDDDFSWVVSATFTPELENEYAEEMLKAMLNMKVSDVPRSPPGEDVNFTIRPNRLVLTDGFVDKLVFTSNGVFPVNEVTEPIFQAGRAIIDFDVEQRQQIAQAIVSPAPIFVIKAISSSKEVKIDGLDGYETIAIGEDTTSGEPLMIYSVTIFDGNEGYVMHGWVSSDTREHYITDFRSLANSFRRKKVAVNQESSPDTNDD